MEQEVLLQQDSVSHEARVRGTRCSEGTVVAIGDKKQFLPELQGGRGRP